MKLTQRTMWFASVCCISTFFITGAWGQTTEDYLGDGTHSPFELPGDSVYSSGNAEDTRALTDVTVGKQSTQPQSVQPQSVQPQSVQPQPVQPQSVQPQSVQPQQVQPQSVQPQSVQPQPVQPQSVQPQSVQPQQVQPQTVQPQSVQPQQVQPQTVQPQSVQPQPVQPQSVQPQQVQPQPVQPQPVQPQFMQPHSAQPQSAQPQSAQPQSAQPQSALPVPRAADATNLAQPMQCDVNSNSGCDAKGFERCMEPGICGCLRGYVRHPGTRKCVAAQFFQGEIGFVDTFTKQLLDKNGAEYTAFMDSVRQLVYGALVSEGAQGVLNVFVTSVSRDTKTKRVTAKWELGVTSASNPQREELMRAYNKGIDDLAYVDPADALIKITDTSLVLGNNGTLATFLMPIIEFSHCVDKDHNYCDVNADCSHRLGSFTCTCRPGFDDVSPDVTLTPGERCVASCGCANNGTCEYDGNGRSTCRCAEWFLGSSCDVNGKEVLIIACSVVGGLLVLTAIFCVICMCTSRRSRKSSRDSTVGVGSLDTSVVKLPRVWMDSARPYELPPRDTRRWSYVSEPVRYVDEYMMDDYVHAETLPLPRSHDAKKKYYAAYPTHTGTLNHGYSSSTLSARPYPRH